MKALINDQTITFDNHTAGDRTQATIEGLHMHKRMNGKRHKGVNIIFPLDSVQNYEFRGRKIGDRQQDQIVNEIQRVIEKDPTKLQNLVEEITGQITRFSQEADLENQTEYLIDGAERIARFFSKKKKVVNKILEKFDQEIELFITQHKKDNDEDFYIKQDVKRRLIKIGDDLEAINYANKKTKIT